MTKVDKSVIALINKKNIINIIREHSPIYKAEIARLTGLSIPTVMKITDEFIKSGLVCEVGTAQSTGGKPPTLLSFVSDSHHIIGVDIGTTNISVILMDLAANIESQVQEPTDISHDFNTILDQTIQCIHRVIDQSSIPSEKILGIGVGVAGLVSPSEGKILFSPDLGWKNKNLLKPLKKHFHLPILVDNVTRAMAVGELWFGLGHNIDNFMCINLGYGIGSAIVIDNKIYEGNNGTSGEFGHITVDQNGPQCDCGSYGCLEALASANAISKQAQQAISNGAVSTMSNIVGDDLKKIDAKVVFDAAKSGDGLANTIIKQATSYLGIAIGSIINFLDPGVIILEGGVSRAGDTLLNPLNDEVMRHIMPVRKPKIVISKLGQNAAAIGAATYLLREFVEHGGSMDSSSCIP